MIDSTVLIPYCSAQYYMFFPDNTQVLTLELGLRIIYDEGRRTNVVDDCP